MADLSIETLVKENPTDFSPAIKDPTGYQGNDEIMSAPDCLEDETFIIECEHCIHYHVCKYRETRPVLPEIPEPFHISLLCDHFRGESENGITG